MSAHCRPSIDPFLLLASYLPLSYYLSSSSLLPFAPLHFSAPPPLLCKGLVVLDQQEKKQMDWSCAAQMTMLLTVLSRVGLSTKAQAPLQTAPVQKYLKVTPSPCLSLIYGKCGMIRAWKKALPSSVYTPKTQFQFVSISPRRKKDMKN